MDTKLHKVEGRMTKEANDLCMKGFRSESGRRYTGTTGQYIGTSTQYTGTSQYTGFTNQVTVHRVQSQYTRLALQYCVQYCVQYCACRYGEGLLKHGKQMRTCTEPPPPLSEEDQKAAKSLASGIASAGRLPGHKLAVKKVELAKDAIATAWVITDAYSARVPKKSMTRSAVAEINKADTQAVGACRAVEQADKSADEVLYVCVCFFVWLFVVMCFPLNTSLLSFVFYGCTVACWLNFGCMLVEFWSRV